ncbi:unnamed protein product [Parajaminaea phylloscopi]
MSDQTNGTSLGPDASVADHRDQNGASETASGQAGIDASTSALPATKPLDAAPSSHALVTDSSVDVAAAQASVGAADQQPSHATPAGDIATIGQPVQPPTSNARAEPLDVSAANGLDAPAKVSPPAPVPSSSGGTSNPYDHKEELDVGASVAAEGQAPEGSTAAKASEIGSNGLVEAGSGESITSTEASLKPLEGSAVPAGNSATPAQSAQQLSVTADPTTNAEPQALAPPLSSLATSATASSPVKAETPPQDAAMSDGTTLPTVAPAVAPSSDANSQEPPIAPLNPISAAEPPAKRQKFSPPLPPPQQQQQQQPTGNVTADPSQISMTQAQIKFAQNSIKSLKQRPEAPAFLVPVDPIALNIPQYRQIIENPMDLGTIDIKLAMTASALKGGKPTEKTKMASQFGLDPSRDVYANVQQWENDVRLVFNNCIRFNGPDHFISASAKALVAVFDKQLNSLPVELPAGGPPAPSASDAASGPAASVDEKKPRRPSNPVPAIRRSSSDASGRPKREIHPPPPRDLPYADEPQSASSGRKKKNKGLTPRQAAYYARVNQQELAFCAKIIDDILVKHDAQAWPFSDLPARDLAWAPSYYATIKRPISFRQILDKQRRHEYADKSELIADVKLMFQNCYTFNQPADDVYVMGKRTETIFEDKLKKMPIPKPMTPEPEDDADEDAEYDVDEEDRLRNEKIRQLEEQLAELKREAKAAKAKASTKKKPRASAGGAGAGAGGSSQGKKASSKGKGSGGFGAGDGAGSKKTSSKKSAKSAAAAEGSDDENDIRAVTWEQKEELASKITQLSDERLDGALQIISEDKPPSANEDEEIELDIEDLSPRTLYRLYRYVVKPKKKPGPKPGTAKGGKSSKAATGGKKRKNLDEEEEAARIARLQEQLQSFDRAPEGAGSAGPGAGLGGGGHDDLVHSDSSSGDEDSDGSESDY